MRTSREDLRQVMITQLLLVLVITIVLLMSIATAAVASLVAGGGGGPSGLPYTETTHAVQTWEAQRVGQLVVN